MRYKVRDWTEAKAASLAAKQHKEQISQRLIDGLQIAQ
jgi:hypothetical protein